MSDIFQNSQKRVIQIKKADFFEKHQPASDLETKETLEGLQEKILQARNELQAVKSEQNRFIEEAESKINEEKQKWQEEKQQWINEAKEEGYRAGFQLGKDEGRQQYEHLLFQANEIIGKAQKDYYSTVEKHEETILQLATEIAEKILKQKLTENPSHFLPIVRAALKEMKEQPEVKIYLHPSKYGVVLEYKEEFQQLLQNDEKLSIYINEDLQEDGCIIEHPFGRLDASVDTQLEQVRRILENIQGNNQ